MEQRLRDQEETNKDLSPLGRLNLSGESKKLHLPRFACSALPQELQRARRGPQAWARVLWESPAVILGYLRSEVPSSSFYWSNRALRSTPTALHLQRWERPQPLLTHPGEAAAAEHQANEKEKSKPGFPSKIGDGLVGRSGLFSQSPIDAHCVGTAWRVGSNLLTAEHTLRGFKQA